MPDSIERQGTETDCRSPELAGLKLTELGFSILKPGFEDCFSGVCKILSDNGLRVVYAEELTLVPEIVDYIYRDCQNEHYYPVMRKYLTEKPCIAMVIAGLGTETQQRLSELKKNKDGTDGILRSTFKKDDTISDNDIDLWSKGLHPDQDQVTILLTQRNVIHSSDSIEETAVSLHSMFGSKFEELQNCGKLPISLQNIFSDFMSRDVTVSYLESVNENRNLPAKS